MKKIICIDGKTMCANKRKEEKPSHIVSAWSKEDVKEYFKEKEFLKEIQEKGCYKKTQEKAHSQIETREYYQTEDIGWMR